MTFARFFSRAPSARAWKWTGLAALLLLAASLALLAWSGAQTPAGVPGQVSNLRGMVFLRAEADVTGEVLAVLRARTPVTVLESIPGQEWDWFRVETEEGDGFVRADQIRLEPETP